MRLVVLYRCLEMTIIGLNSGKSRYSGSRINYSKQTSGASQCFLLFALKGIDTRVGVDIRLIAPGHRFCTPLIRNSDVRTHGLTDQ